MKNSWFSWLLLLLLVGVGCDVIERTDRGEFDALDDYGNHYVAKKLLPSSEIRKTVLTGYNNNIKIFADVPKESNCWYVAYWRSDWTMDTYTSIVIHVHGYSDINSVSWQMRVGKQYTTVPIIEVEKPE